MTTPTKHTPPTDTDIGIGLKELSRALGEWDYAMRAASFGSTGNRDVLINAIKNLPTPELNGLRSAVAAAIKAAVSRTDARVRDLGIVMDTPHPLRVRASIDDPGSYFYYADEERKGKS